jgi:hypothetical protein
LNNLKSQSIKICLNNERYFEYKVSNLLQTESDQNVNQVNDCETSSVLHEHSSSRNESSSEDSQSETETETVRPSNQDVFSNKSDTELNEDDTESSSDESDFHRFDSDKEEDGLSEPHAPKVNQLIS